MASMEQWQNTKIIAEIVLGLASDTDDVQGAFQSSNFDVHSKKKKKGGGGKELCNDTVLFIYIQAMIFRFCIV